VNPAFVVAPRNVLLALPTTAARFPATALDAPKLLFIRALECLSLGISDMDQDLAKVY
jgi:hypothetical protein